MKADRLFLVKHCPECSLVRAVLRPEIAESDKVLGKQGQRLLVFSALSDDAGRELLDKFGLTKNFAPILLTHEGAVHTDPKVIVSYLRENGLA